MPTSDAGDPVAKYWCIKCTKCVGVLFSPSSHFRIYCANFFLVLFLFRIDLNFTHLCSENNFNKLKWILFVQTFWKHHELSLVQILITWNSFDTRYHVHTKLYIYTHVISKKFQFQIQLCNSPKETDRIDCKFDIVLEFRMSNGLIKFQ